MDSFFKAAVCDLDKLLDDFELNTEEHDCKTVFLKPSVYPFSSLDAPPTNTSSSSVPPNLPDLNSLHYGNASSCPERSSPNNNNNSQNPHTRSPEGLPLTAVDLLSSVDRRPSKNSAPPCPDRALKPVCDLVNDTSSAILVRSNSRNAFNELDVVEQKMSDENYEALLVDFESPVVTAYGEIEEQACVGINDLPNSDSHVKKSASGEYSASLSLLDVILPAEVEKSCEKKINANDDDESPLLPRTTEESADVQERGCEEEEEGREEVVTVAVVACTNQVMENSLDHREQEENGSSAVDSVEEIAAAAALVNEEMESEEDLDKGVNSDASERKPSGLSCLPLAVSMCGALVKSKTSVEPSAQSDEPEADSNNKMSSSESSENSSVCVSNQIVDGRESPEGQHISMEPAIANIPSTDVPPEPSPIDPREFGFEYLPESDQAELLVTDEELDAFLQAHTEAEQASGSISNRVNRSGVSYCCGSQPENGLSGSNSNGDLEGRLVEEELWSGSRVATSRREDLDVSACPESERTMCVSVDHGRSHLQQMQEAESCQEERRPGGLSLSLTSNSANVISHDLQPPPPPPSYGGARPKQLHCQTPKSPVEEEENQADIETPGESTKDLNAEEDEDEEDGSPTSPSLTEGQCNIQDLSPMYPSQESHQMDYSVGYDELSEPPPYPGECPTEGARSAGWKREGGGGEDLGSRQPSWVPDAEAPNCMNCYQRFTFTKRRHHCRACGKVYCAVCCNRKCKLKYLEKEARVCVICFDTIHRAAALERMMSPAGPSPNPNVPSEYCSTIPPLQQARAAGTLNSPPPTVMVPVSVLKHPNNDSCPREQKRVWFADGILPNGEVADTSKLCVTSRRSSQEFSGVSPDQTTPGPAASEESLPEGCPTSAAAAAVEVEVVRAPVSGPWDYSLLSALSSSVSRVPSLLPDTQEELPPLLITTGEDDTGDILVEESPAPCQILHLLEEGGPRPLTFVLNANLLVNVKLVTYSSRHCWCFASNGLQALGQRELVFLLEVLPDEKSLPKDLFTLYLNIYQEAQKGKFLEEYDNVTFTSSFLGSKDHAGMLFFCPTCQPLDGLTLPTQPFLCGLLIQKLEVPWAKVFPLRLLLRLGAEYSVYPTPLISVRFRDSVYRETGHTIMNLLADLRNYQYSLSVVQGMRIHMEMGHSYIDIPKSSFNEMQKVVNASNEHVISIGAHFSSEADSHLVCFQNQDANYQTQANSKPGKTRTVTGASFVVFNGALKASSGFIAKSSIVEDGLMVQIPPETMESLRVALREQTDFQIPCGRNDGGELREIVSVRWIDWKSPVNTGRTSGVDARPLDGVYSVRMLQDTEFDLDGRSIRCTEVFYQLKTPDVSLSSVLSSCSVFQKELALAACGALTPHLAVLSTSGINSLSLRISTQADMVEYQAGSGGRLLPQRYMNELDSALIPVIHGGSASVPSTPMDMEFTFYITHTI